MIVQQPEQLLLVYVFLVLLYKVMIHQKRMLGFISVNQMCQYYHKCHLAYTIVTAMITSDASILPSILC